MNNFEDNKKLVYFIFYKYFSNIKNKNDREDLIQEGFVGLCKAVKTFDKSKGTKFSTYATKCIYTAMAYSLRSDRKNRICSTFSELSNDDSDFEVEDKDNTSNLIEVLFIRQCIKEVISTFEKGREILVINLWLNDYRKSEIAREYKISINSIRTIIDKFKFRLKEYYIKEVGNGEINITSC